MSKRIALLLLTIFLFCARSYAQHEHTDPKKEKAKEKTGEMQHQHMQMQEMEHGGNPASGFLMNEGAGTGVNPASIIRKRFFRENSISLLIIDSCLTSLSMQRARTYVENFVQRFVKNLVFSRLTIWNSVSRRCNSHVN